MGKTYTHICLGLLLSLLTVGAFGQNQNNFWYFGDGNFMDFNGGAPTIAGNGIQIATATSTYCLEGSSTMCDAGGNLLFYSDGRTVWDQNYVAMPNGTGLNGHLSAAQTLIVPKPGSATVYYIFHMDFAGNANGLSYSEVDMTLNGGMGDVTAVKNVPLHTPSSEQLKAVTHCNGNDIWVLSHSATGNTFYAYEVTTAGVNTTAVVSNIGTGLPNNFAGMSYMTCTKDGSRIALANDTSFELFDFDNQNGTLCSVVTVPTGGFVGVYGIEFSPDATKLYTTDFGLTQFDLTSNVPATISASAVNLPVNEPAALMRGPDDKVYIASGCDYYDAGTNTMYAIREIHQIESPNNAGLACNLQTNFFTTPRECGLGLPTNYYPTQSGNSCGAVLAASFTATPNLLCEGDCVTITNNSSGPIVSTNWTFPGGTPATHTGANPPQVCYATAGTYTVTMTVEDCAGNIETDNVVLTVDPCNGSTVNFTTPDQNLCEGDCIAFQDLTNGTNITSWSWSFPGGTPATSNDQNPGNICYTTPGQYDVTLTITDDNGMATETMSNYITVINCDPPVAAFTSPLAVCAGSCVMMTDQSTSAVSWNWTLNGGNPATSSDQNPTVCFETPGLFTLGLEVTNANGFTDYIEHQIEVFALPFVDAGPDASVKPGEEVMLEGQADPGTFLWTPANALDCDDCLTPLAMLNETTVFTLLVTDANGCENSDLVTLTVEDETFVYVPNAFTPNGDGLNDVFQPSISSEVEDYHLLIFDRWGNIVFESRSAASVWDAHADQDGVYVWKLDLQYAAESGGEYQSFVGHVTVLH